MVVPQNIQENPESLSEPENNENDNNIPRIEIEVPLRIGLESSSQDEFEEATSEEENDDVAINNEQPAEQNEAVDYGFDEDYIGDTHFTLYSRRDVYLLKGW